MADEREKLILKLQEYGVDAEALQRCPPEALREFLNVVQVATERRGQPPGKRVRD